MSAVVTNANGAPRVKKLRKVGKKRPLPQDDPDAAADVPKKKKKKKHHDEPDTQGTPPSDVQPLVSQPTPTPVPNEAQELPSDVQPPVSQPTPTPIPNEAQEAVHTDEAIHIDGDNADQHPPIKTFAESGFRSSAMQCLAEHAGPTPIQSACWPLLSAGRDVVGVAVSGSGKTLAFALPSLAHLPKKKKKKDAPPRRFAMPSVLVMAPTRELACQITAVYTDQLGVDAVCLFGGVPRVPQQQQLQQGTSVVVATPGRLLDLTRHGFCNLKGVTLAVLDEADRMLDQGFSGEICQIMRRVEARRQTVMFTATWVAAVQGLADQFLTQPVRVTIGSGTDLTTNRKINQIVMKVDASEKDTQLVKVVKERLQEASGVIVFTLYKKDIPTVEALLISQGCPCRTLHGGMSQPERMEVMAAFQAKEVPVLVATDVAGRGLHVEHLTSVVNYGMPLTIEEYIHRIGRTARGGREGVAVTLFDPEADRLLGHDLAKALREAGQTVEPWLDEFPPRVRTKDREGVVKRMGAPRRGAPSNRNYRAK